MLTALVIIGILILILLGVLCFAQLYIIGQNNIIILNMNKIFNGMPAMLKQVQAVVAEQTKFMGLIK